jgi:hypothetical protein
MAGAQVNEGAAVAWYGFPGGRTQEPLTRESIRRLKWPRVTLKYQCCVEAPNNPFAAKE